MYARLRGLNPFDIRAVDQTTGRDTQGSAMRLNPFDIRAVDQTAILGQGARRQRLNPFDIRAVDQTDGEQRPAVGSWS